MKTKIHYRKALAADAEALARLRIQQLLDEGYAETANIKQELINYFSKSVSNGSFIGWLAEKEEEMIATGGLCFYQLPPTFSNPSGQISYLTNVYTVPSFRKQGIATEIIHRLIAEAKAHNAPSIRLHASNLGKSLYQQFGFEDLDGFMFLSFES